MSRLFITERELNFISDITKEVIKDCVGQKIILYPISEIKTKTDGIYNESLEKVFDKPIYVDCLVDSVFHEGTRIDTFGVDQKYRIEAFVQYRDTVDKGINIEIGDFFSFGNIMYEITNKNIIHNIFGLPEHKDGFKIVGTKAREGQFKVPFIGPTDISYTDNDAVQKEFMQQRGFTSNIEGDTYDKRDLVANGTLEQPISTPKKVSEDGSGGHGSSFYGDE